MGSNYTVDLAAVVESLLKECELPEVQAKFHPSYLHGYLTGVQVLAARLTSASNNPGLSQEQESPAE